MDGTGAPTIKNVLRTIFGFGKLQRKRKKCKEIILHTYAEF
jgi:hypothetical protein